MEQDRALGEFLITSTIELGITLTDQQVGQFLVYLSQLLHWNRTTNLTSITDPYEVISKHFVDSLAVLKALKIPLEGVVIDVGSGGGFPGMPLKIVRQDLRMFLVEPSLKKCSFLRSVVGTLRIEGLSVFAGTLSEYVAEDGHAMADVVVVRALSTETIASPATLTLKPEGHLVLYGTTKTAEHAPSAFRIDSTFDFSLPLHHGQRVLTVLKKAVGV